MKNHFWKLFASITIILITQASARAQTIDRIIAVVGDEIILESDVDNQYNYMLINGQKDDGSLRCQVMDNLIVSKLLLNKAIQDSLTASEAQVLGEVERRTEYAIKQLGSEEEFARIYGKSSAQFREDIKEDIRNELLIDQQRSELLSASDITPKEVKTFFNSLDKDSLGLLPAEVQVNHIVITPPWSESSVKRAKETLTEVRRQIVEEGADFGEMAAANSDEPGAKERKGSLGTFGRGQMVSEFEEVVYQMRVGEISNVFKTDFGYHVVKLEGRKGEVVTASHVLKIPKASANGDSIAIDSLNRILELIAVDSLTFEQAAILYSSDRMSKYCGGCISNPQTQELRISMDALDPDMYFKIDAMETGEISKPMELVQQDNSRSFHVLYLKNKIPPHRPNLKDDYQKIRNAALQTKQAENFDKWLQSAKKNIYIDIKPTECSNALKNWVE